jgi:hypothetical protein
MENNEILNIYKNYQKKINEMWRLLWHR